MSIQITSTTDSEEAVLSALGNATPNKDNDEVLKSVSSGDKNNKSKQDEIIKESDTLNNDELENSDEIDSEDESLIKDDEKENQKPKKKGGFQKRIERFQKKISDKDLEIEHWKREALKSKPTENIEQPQYENLTLKEKPKAEHFESHEEYVDALTDWKIEQKEKDREVKLQHLKLKSEYENRVQTFQSKVAEFSIINNDFQEVVSEVDDIPLSLEIQEAILSSDFGPNIMYELAKNREELQRISRLSGISAAREIGKIEAQFNRDNSKSNSVQDRKITKAPPPIIPVGSKNSARIEKSPDEMSFQEYKKWRETKK